MKKILISIVLLFVFSSCTKVIINESIDYNTELTTFCIINNLKLYPSIEYIDGSLWEVIVYYYAGNALIDYQVADPILTGEQSKLINVPIGTDGIIYSFKFAPKKSIYYNNINCRRYSEFIKLIKGKNTKIEIHDLSKIIETE